MSYQAEKHNTDYSFLNLFLRSLIFSIFSLTTMLLFSFVCVASLLFPLYYRWKIIRAWLIMLLWALKKVCKIDYVVDGLEHISATGAGIIMCKHQSTFETFLLPILFKEPAIILKRELLWIPFFGWGLAASKPIAINRQDRGTAMQQIIAKGRACLQAGRWIMIFPEGTRVPYGQIGHYRLGGARLAVATGYPIIPVAHNAGKFWPRRKFIKIPGTVHMVIGPPIVANERTPEEVLTETKLWIENTILTI